MKRLLYTFITTKQSGVIPNLFRILLMPLCWLYRSIVSIRNYCYNVGIRKQKKLPCTVISVGNIVVGGTGKTPAAATIARMLQKKGKRVAILLRGYKRRSTKKVLFVSDGENHLCTREESGDEADMLARQIINVPIVVGKQRYQTGKAALDRFNSEILILDDSFQHRQLARDLDIITIDATRPYGTNALLPIGSLREPKAAVQRADIILLTRTDAIDIQIQNLRKQLKSLAPNTLILESVHQPTSLSPLNNKDKHSTIPLQDLKGKRILAVCGIGNPTAFVATIEKFHPEIVELFAFPDHHVYTESDIQNIHEQMKRCNTEWIITTQKDEQKLADHTTELPILVLAVELVITNGENVLLDKLQISNTK
ncbi:MAG: tetraacyldisaccharide 4'-kinase [Candidatus Poribacteria bacterium]|nr:tetraacyldisaccharide 4'-kinase [Candidatus Poribacteria bacterium]